MEPAFVVQGVSRVTSESSAFTTNTAALPFRRWSLVRMNACCDPSGENSPMKSPDPYGFVVNRWRSWPSVDSTVKTPLGRFGRVSSQVSQVRRVPSGVHPQHATLSVGCVSSNSRKPVPSALIVPVVTLPSGAKAAKISRLPSGDHLGPPTAWSVSRMRALPSGSFVKT